MSCRKLYSLLLLTVITVSLSQAAANPRQRPFRSIKAKRETVENYEVVMPVITSKDGAKPYPTEMTIEITTSAAHYVLKLAMNKVLMPKHFTSIYFDSHGRQVVDKTPHVNCYYQGEVEGHPDWTVTLSTCHGLQGEFGKMLDRENYFHLEPLDQENPSVDQLHAFYLDSEYEEDAGGCGSGEGHRVIADMIPGNFSVDSHGARVRRQTISGLRFVEWFVVNDNRQYNVNNENLAATIQRALAIANGADNIFRALSIRIVLTGTMTFTNGDAFVVPTSPNSILSAFSSYVASQLANTVDYDSTMLITGIDLDASTVGIARVGTMCNRFSSIGVSQDGIRQLGGVVTTVAHELGHIFNMNHDDGRSCSCSASSCVMAAISRPPPATTWSSCSVSDLNELYNFGGDSCLFNTPTEMVGDPTCGNGIREGSESCDCGSPTECTDPCCNAATCELAEGAQCARGGCCTAQCRLIAYGTQCRAATNECDVAEYCPGTSGECPEDNHVANGISCNSNLGYCMEGVCPTHNDQCMATFGSRQSVQGCYDRNTRGERCCNCGGTTPCAAADVRCGQLQCNGGNYTGIFNAAGTIFGGPCSSFSPSNAEQASLGQVADGTRCADGRVCEGQRCVTLSSLNLPLACPTNSTGQQCSGPTRGVCNNRGTCSCNVGWEGDACELVRDEDECFTNNGGCQHICTNTRGSFTCSCNPGFSLAANNRDCVDTDECALGRDNCPQLCDNTMGSFTCRCRAGFESVNNGASCVDIDECTRGTHNCQQRCTNRLDGGFTCSCESGYVLNSDQATCRDVNECATSNGGCEETCVNSAGSFECMCPEGYSLTNGRFCDDIDECDQNMDNCEQDCRNTVGSFECTCGTGYRLNANGRTCDDINECSANTDGCEDICINNAGSFTCDCDPGYALDTNGRTCTNVNECAMGNGGCSDRCMDTVGSFQCFCPPNFILDQSDQRTCIPINQCPPGDRANCENDRCIVENGVSTCFCLNGYALRADRSTCADVNECELNTDGCEHMCTNMIGSFECSCRSGFQLSPNGRDCLDTNECVVDRGGCSQECSNSPPGSFSCVCRSGFTLASDGVSCTDVNECETDANNCQGLCINTDGGFTCGCEPGYTLGDDGVSCNDVDECSTDRSGCKQICANTEGSFQCGCNEGYVLDRNGFSCNDVNECIRGDNGGCPQRCINSVASFSCGCYSGFTLTDDGISCTATSPCTSSAQCEQLCHSENGMDVCSCRYGFILNSDGTTCADVNECEEGTSNSTSNDCEQICTNLEGGFRCSCNEGLFLATDLITCTNSTPIEIMSEMDDNGGSPVGAIVGGVFGTLIGVGLIAAAIVVVAIFVAKKRKGKSRRASMTRKPYTNSNSVPQAVKVELNGGSAEDLLDRGVNTNSTDVDLDDSFSDNSYEDEPPPPYTATARQPPPRRPAPAFQHKPKPRNAPPKPPLPAATKPHPPPPTRVEKSKPTPPKPAAFTPNQPAKKAAPPQHPTAPPKANHTRTPPAPPVIANGNKKPTPPPPQGKPPVTSPVRSHPPQAKPVTSPVKPHPPKPFPPSKPSPAAKPTPLAKPPPAATKPSPLAKPPTPTKPVPPAPTKPVPPAPTKPVPPAPTKPVPPAPTKPVPPTSTKPVPPGKPVAAPKPAAPPAKPAVAKWPPPQTEPKSPLAAPQPKPRPLLPQVGRRDAPAPSKKPMAPPKRF